MSINLSLSDNTKLNDRVLYFDGDSVISTNAIIDCIFAGVDLNQLHVDIIDNDIEEFNQTRIDKITTKKDMHEIDATYNIPETYQKLDVLNHVINRYTEIGDISPDRMNRILYEMKIFRESGLIDYLRTLIYVQTTFEDNGIIKGVGRGSSVSSYVLYLIGIHMIDSFKYDLDFREFIKED